MAIEGYLHSNENGKRPLIVVGKTNTPHGKELLTKYGKEKGVKFVGGIYDFNKLNYYMLKLSSSPYKTEKSLETIIRKTEKRKKVDRI